MLVVIATVKAKAGKEQELSRVLRAFIKPTRRETEIIVRGIPRLDWASIADLFQPEAEFAGPVDLEAFTAISDPDDRKFAALSAAVNVPLITNDGRVLAEGGAVGIEALTPRAFLERKGESG